jgi:membrane protein DedA with SNARE-associated domain
MIDSVFAFAHRVFAWAISGAPESYPALFLVVALGEIVAITPLVLEGLYLTAGINVAGASDVAVLQLYLTTLSGAEAGAAVVYWATRAGQRPILSFVLARLSLRNEQAQTMQSWLHRAGVWPVALGRLIPGLGIPISFLAGVLRLPYPQFFLGVLISNALWSTLFLAMGILLRLGVGGIQPNNQHDVDAFKIGVLIIAFLTLGAFLVYLVRRPRSAHRSSTSILAQGEDKPPAEG